MYCIKLFSFDSWFITRRKDRELGRFERISVHVQRSNIFAIEFQLFIYYLFFFVNDRICLWETVRKNGTAIPLLVVQLKLRLWRYAILIPIVIVTWFNARLTQWNGTLVNHPSSFSFPLLFVTRKNHYWSIYIYIICDTDIKLIILNTGIYSLQLRLKH